MSCPHEEVYGCKAKIPNNSALLSVAALFVIRRNLGIIRGTIHNSGTGTVRERGKYRDLEWVIDVPE